MPRLSSKAILSSLPYVIENQFEELKYRVYVTDALYCISNGSLSKRYFDMLNLPKHKDERTGDEIATEIMKRMELTYESV